MFTFSVSSQNALCVSLWTKKCVEYVEFIFLSVSSCSDKTDPFLTESPQMFQTL